VKLVAAGFDWSLMEKFNGYFEELLLAHGDRTTSLPQSPEERKIYDTNLELALDERKVCRLIMEHIVESINDDKLKQIYNKIQNGSGVIDTLSDNISFTSIIPRYMELATQIRPGGKVVTVEYLEEAKKRAVMLLKMRGIVVENGVPKDDTVEYQNRIITLCVKALAYIRKFARAAFYNDIPHYNRYYVSKNSRTVSPDEPDTIDTTIDQPELETV
jgi:hypothetical protein